MKKKKRVLHAPAVPFKASKAATTPAKKEEDAQVAFMAPTSDRYDSVT